MLTRDDDAMTAPEPVSASLSNMQIAFEVALLVAIFFVYAGDQPPLVNEAHYLVKAKNFWQPQWCQNDLFAASGKAHTTFYLLFGWPTLFVSLETTAWMGRVIGWLMLSVGLQRLCCKLLRVPYASLGVAVLWIVGIQHGNLAGEWVVGGIEAKIPAYGLVLLALAEMADRRWSRVWPLLGAASAFHVLSGGWSVIAAMITWAATERGRDDCKRFFTPALFLGGAISLFGLLPAISLTLGSSSENAAAAARIYAYFRIKHHLLPADFLVAWYVRHGLLIAATIGITCCFRKGSDGWNRMRWFTMGAIGIAAAGLVVGMLPAWAPDLAAKLLRFYWFRLADAIVPLMFGLIVMRLVIDAPQIGRHVGKVILLVAIALFSHTSYEKAQLGVPPSVSSELLGWDVQASPRQQQQVYDDWRKVCFWVRDFSEQDELFLTPRHQQTFKWYAERAEVVNWKDVPQDAKNLLEWNRRFRDIFPRRLGTIRVTIGYNTLKRFRQQYKVRYMIVDRRITGDNLPLVRIYPTGVLANETYAVYELPQP